MKKKKTVAVIIPCYNEGKRVLNVLKAVKQAKLVGEIIVVDDSSDGKTKKKIYIIIRLFSATTTKKHIKHSRVNKLSANFA